MAANKIDLIRQALNASESSIKLARQLLAELENEGKKVGTQNKASELPGVVGMFDGKDMVTELAERFPVPENYASKSILVVGDILKLAESGGEKRFKQIEHVKRHKTSGIITKKEGKWTAVTPEGSYRLLSAAVDHFGADVGDEILIQLPANNLQTTWAAVEKITKKSGEKDVKPEPSKEKEEKTEPTLEVRNKVEKQQLKPEIKETAAPKKIDSEKNQKEDESKEIKIETEKVVPKEPAIKSTEVTDKTHQDPKTKGVKQEMLPASSELSEDELS